jgi:hypothetical protein
MKMRRRHRVMRVKAMGWHKEKAGGTPRKSPGCFMQFEQKLKYLSSKIILLEENLFFII